MQTLNQKYLEKIEQFLDEQDLTFKPLREEIIDHIFGDLESQIQEGKSFEDAWNNITSDIPESHFKTIQSETMSAINKRFNASKVFSIISLALLAISSIFKLLHLPGTVVMLMTSMIALAISFAISSISGIRLYKKKHGALLMMITVVAILLFGLSWMLHILNFPSTFYFKITSVISLLILFPMLTIYFYVNLKSEDNIITYLHKRHTPGIERYLISLLFIAVTLRLASIIFQYPPYVSKILLALTALSAGLQFFALNWQPMKTERNSRWLTLALVISFAFFIFPMLGSVLNLTFRVVLTTSFYVIAGTICLYRDEKIYNKIWATLLVIIISFVFVFWSFIRLEIIGTEYYAFIFNIPVLIGLFLGLFFSGKYSYLRTYLIIVIAHYIYEYPESIGLF